MFLFLNFLTDFCLTLVYRSIIGKRKIVMFLVMLPSLITSTNPTYVFNANTYIILRPLQQKCMSSRQYSRSKVN